PGRLERFEDRHAARDVLVGAADHQPVAILDPPDAAGDTDVQVPDAMLSQPLAADRVVVEPRVATVDHDIPGRQHGTQLVDGGVGDLRGHHHPHGARRCELVGQLMHARDVGDGGIAVVADDLVPGTAHAYAHVAAHPAETDETELHLNLPWLI